ncbi:hypothetical protein C6A85_32930, partial [Mycobacterium sp. ITM-2017-0098]
GAYALFAPRDANRSKRVEKTRLYSGAALIAGAAFMAANAVDRIGWARYVFGAVALGLLVGAAVVFAKNREK